MLIFIILLLLIIFKDIKVCGNKNEFHTDYCSQKQTSTINGICTILIFLSHSRQYITLDGNLDAPYLALNDYMLQLVVVPFLFYSGFGIMESINKKGMPYVKSIPTNRFFKTWYHFAIALIPYVILGIIFNKGYTLKRIVLSFTGWSSIGNSNWYMFVTFALYLIVFLAFIIARKYKALGVALVLIFTLGFALFEYKMGLGSRYYNTILCFPLGMIFSLIKPYIDKIVMKNDIMWCLSFTALFAAYYYFASNKKDTIIHYILWCFLAMSLILLFTMKVKIGNSILDWFSNHIFSVFFLQRIPMIILEELGYTKHRYAFIVVSFIATVLLATVFDEAMAWLDSKIYKRKNVNIAK